jgi:peptidoglycan-associated lipoprotein
MERTSLKGDEMKKIIILSLSIFLIFAYLISCKPKQAPEFTPPPAPVPQEQTPVVKEQPIIEKVEKVEEAEKKLIDIQFAELSEEEIFLKKSLVEINQESPIQMIHFDFDKFFIREDAKPALEANAKWLKKYSTVKILLEGYCDERGTEEYNLALGEKRAKSTFDYLVSLGIAPIRMLTVSYGKSQPLDKGHNEIAWQKNRRTQFTIIGK